MTPEEILAECPELELRQSNFYLETNYFVRLPYVKLLAQSRKEARELREQNKHLQGQLRYFIGGRLDG